MIRALWFVFVRTPINVLTWRYSSCEWHRPYQRSYRTSLGNEVAHG